MSALARGRALLILVSTLVVATGPGAAARADVPQVGGEWVYTGSMVTWHFDHTATLLADGDVLVVAGHHRDSAEVYDLASGTWSETGFMAAYHAWGQTATRLADRRVLVAGGDTDFGPSARTELYDPRSRSWRLSGDMALARENHIAAVLPQGRVLVAGGEIPGGVTATAELYLPKQHRWRPTTPMHQRRFDAVAVSLPDGRILVIGGVDGGSGALASAETYDPVSRTWSFAGSMSTGRWDHGAVVLPDGRVLVAGGRCCGDAPGAGQPQGQALGTAELFDPPTGTWTLTGSLSVPRQRATLTLLGNGLVLCAGGYDGQGNDYATAELYDPATGTWSPAASMNEERWGHTATLLPTGTVLAAGGIGTSGQTAELYLPDPSPTL